MKTLFILHDLPPETYIIVRSKTGGCQKINVLDRKEFKHLPNLFQYSVNPNDYIEIRISKSLVGIFGFNLDMISTTASYCICMEESNDQMEKLKLIKPSASIFKQNLYKILNKNETANISNNDNKKDNEIMSKFITTKHKYHSYALPFLLSLANNRCQAKAMPILLNLRPNGRIRNVDELLDFSSALYKFLLDNAAQLTISNTKDSFFNYFIENYVLEDLRKADLFGPLVAIRNFIAQDFLKLTEQGISLRPLSCIERNGMLRCENISFIQQAALSIKDESDRKKCATITIEAYHQAFHNQIDQILSPIADSISANENIIVNCIMSRLPKEISKFNAIPQQTIHDLYKISSKFLAGCNQHNKEELKSIPTKYLPVITKYLDHTKISNEQTDSNNEEIKKNIKMNEIIHKKEENFEFVTINNEDLKRLYEINQAQNKPIEIIPVSEAPMPKRDSNAQSQQRPVVQRSQPKVSLQLDLKPRT